MKSRDPESDGGPRTWVLWLLDSFVERLHHVTIRHDDDADDMLMMRAEDEGPSLERGHVP